MPKFPILAAALLVLSPAAFAQTQPSMFPFVIPWDDSTPGTATDMSFLNAKPAGVNGSIVVRDGHFAEANTGKRVRFLGTNFTFHSNYPTHEDAVKIAAHIAKLGINIVRIHHHDTNPLPLWDQSTPARGKFDPQGIDRLDFLISEFKKQGIYVDLNMKVSRAFTPEDGFPASVKSLPWSQKPIDEIDRKMIDLQKQFARDYLTHVNPYTKLSYAEDPVVAIVEIANENTLAGGPNAGTSFFAGLPEYFRNEVVASWTDYLLRKYQNTNNLKNAWLGNATANTGPSDYLNSTSKWFLEDNGRNVKVTNTGPGTSTTAPDIEAYNPTPSAPEWGKQLSLGQLDLQENSAYIVSFRAKADKTRTVPLFSGVTAGDYHSIGLNAKVALTTEWQNFRFSFVAVNTIPNVSRVGIMLAGDSGTVSLADFRISRPSADDVLPAGKSLETRNLELPDQSTAQQRADWRAFLVDTESAYIAEMRDYLRKELKVRANITGSQMSYGGMMSLHRETESDFCDDHDYWQHPIGNLGSTAWKIGNTPMSDALARWEGGTFAELATYRIAGKPFTVSEYCHPAPSDYRSEMFPEIMSFAALQDWDIVFQFDYGGYGDSKPWEHRFEPFTPDHIQNFFAMQGDPSKEAFAPGAALLFRTGQISPAASKVTLKLPPSTPYTLSVNKAMQQWKVVGHGKLPDILANRLEMVLDPAVTQPQIVKTNGTATADSGLSVSLSNDGSRFIARGPAVLAAAGYFGGTETNFGPVTLKFPEFGNNFTAFILTALDNQPLGQSKRLLLTIGGKSENPGMAFNADRTSIGQAWGKGPVQTEGIPVTITLANGSVKKIWALSTTGARGKEVPVNATAAGISANVGAEYQTLWYEIAAQ